MNSQEENAKLLYILEIFNNGYSFIKDFITSWMRKNIKLFLGECEFYTL
jgi:hypothetical protein